MLVSREFIATGHTCFFFFFRGDSASGSYPPQNRFAMWPIRHLGVYGGTSEIGGFSLISRQRPPKKALIPAFPEFVYETESEHVIFCVPKILWIEEILHLRNPGGMVPLSPTNMVSCGLTVVRTGFRVWCQDWRVRYPHVLGPGLVPDLTSVTQKRVFGGGTRSWAMQVNQCRVSQRQSNQFGLGNPPTC